MSLNRDRIPKAKLPDMGNVPRGIVMASNNRNSPGGAVRADAELQEVLKDCINAHVKGIRAEFKREQDQMMAGFRTELLTIEQRVAMGTIDRSASPAGDGGTVAISAAVQSFQADPTFQKASEVVSRGSSPSGLNLRVMENMPIRAFLGTGTGTSDGDITTPDRSGLYSRSRPLRLLDVLPHRPVASNIFQYMRVDSDDEASEQDYEGDEKKDLDIAATLVNGYVATIAAHSTASKQVLADVASLQSAMSKLIGFKVLSRLEHQLINGTGGDGKIDGLLALATTLVPTLATTSADIIGESLVRQANYGYMPDLILLNPLDWFTIQSEKDGEQRYLFSSPNVPVPPALWNASIVTTPSMPEGSGMTIDTRHTTVMDREQLSFAISNTHNDNFTKNLVTILGELRAGLEVTDPFAVYKFDLAASS